MFCPVCNNLPIQSWSVVRDDGGVTKRFSLGRCGICAAIFDHRVMTVNSQTDEKLQALVNHDYYRQEFSEQEFSEKYQVNQRMIGAFVHFFKKRQTFVEIGMGLGFLCRAASPIFDNCYGLDLEIETATATGPKAENVHFSIHSDFLSNHGQQISALCAWHVVEHLANPHEVLAPLLNSIESEGVFFGQIPLYRTDYVFDAHYLFHCEQSLIMLTQAYGFNPVYFQRDEENGFLSFAFRKN